jgi:hypothetical protein
VGHENENNRSTAMTPELIAQVNAAVGEGIKAAIQGLFTELAPLLRDLNKPYVDPAIAARQLRDQMKFKKEEKEGEQNKRLTRERCPHRYATNKLPSIGLVQNFPDKHVRGICMQCQDWIHPKEWQIGAPTKEHPEGEAVLVPEHPKYAIVIEAMTLKNAGA